MTDILAAIYELHYNILPNSSAFLKGGSKLYKDRELGPHKISNPGSKFYGGGPYSIGNMDLGSIFHMTQPSSISFTQGHIVNIGTKSQQPMH